jgi:hypothetical protein
MKAASGLGIAVWMRAEELQNKEARNRHGLFILYFWQAPDRNAARLLRPPAIVPNVGAIYPRNRLTIDTARDTLQCLVWDIEMKNYLVAFGAINNVTAHGTIP